VNGLIHQKRKKSRMNTKEKYGHLCVMLLSGITLGLIAGATSTLGTYYGVDMSGIGGACLFPGLALGTTGLVGIICIMTHGIK
jgi:hypothetical protein